MPDSDLQPAPRARENPPADHLRSKLLFPGLGLVAAVLALSYFSPGMAHTPDYLSIQDVVERTEAGTIKPAAPAPVIRPDPSGGRDWVIITGESRKDVAAKVYRPFRAAGRLTDANLERLQKSKLFIEQPAQTLLTSMATQVAPYVLIIGALYFLLVRPLRQAVRDLLEASNFRPKG